MIFQEPLGRLDLPLKPFLALDGLLAILVPLAPFAVEFGDQPVTFLAHQFKLGAHRTVIIVRFLFLTCFLFRCCITFLKVGVWIDAQQFGSIDTWAAIFITIRRYPAAFDHSADLSLGLSGGAGGLGNGQLHATFHSFH